MISQDSIEALKERSNIVEIIGEGVALKRQGTGYLGLCPFHAEKTPSFHVRDSENFYHCFGCGASGNVITYVMQSRGLTFPEAVEELAARYGVDLKRDGVGAATDAGVRKDVLYRVNNFALEFFQQNLRQLSLLVSEYLKSRRLSPATCAEFAVGYAPNSGCGLCEALKKSKISEQSMLQAGLVRRGTNGELYDVFRGRVIFPIFGDMRRVAGFAGRLVPGLASGEIEAKLPKYINSSETAVYQKSQLLYNLPRASDSVRKSGEVIVVEGYLDVISMWCAGIHNVAATCGTAFTAQHAQRLSRIAKRVLVLFDGDTAGKAAAAKCFPSFLNSGLEARVLFLPDSEDPDTYSLKHGDLTLQRLAECQAVPLLECYIRGLSEKYEISDPRELGASAKGKVAQVVANTLARVENVVELAELLERAAFILGVREELLKGLLSGGKLPIEAQKSSESPVARQVLPAFSGTVSTQRQEVNSLPPLDREILLAVMAHRELAVLVLRDGDVCTALRPATRQFVEGVHSVLQQFDADSDECKKALKELLFTFGESWLDHWRRAHKMLNDESAGLNQAFDECLHAVRKAKLNQAITLIDGEIRACTSEPRRLELLQEKLVLSRKRMEVAGANSTKTAGGL